MKLASVVRGLSIRSFTLMPAACLAIGLGTLAGCASSTSSSAAPRVAGPTSPQAQQVFAKVKGLEGNWYGKDDKGNEQLMSVYKVSSAGSIVRETMFPGSDHEMTNMYHCDGDRVVVTHYCAGGNQPRMACGSAAPDGSCVFVMDSVTNLAAANTSYMGGLTLHMPAKDTLVQEWQNYKGSQPAGDHNMRFEWRRR